MKSLLLFVFSALVITNLAEAQVMKGNISNAAGDPVQYTTVYIQELKQGTLANTKGDYEIKLQAGNYNVFFQSMGYASESRKVTITEKGIHTVNIVLQSQYYQLPEIRISSSGEDPAYVIMRKAIGFAPYYLSQVKSYKADVYLKGNLEVVKIPRLLQRSLKIDANNTTIKSGDSFMMESVNEITFTAPDKYIQRVISFNSTFPAGGDEISPMDFIQASFYEPVIADMAISPLSPAAFSHYNFKYEGATLQGEYLVDKITVLPKRKSQQLFSGTIYIIEDLWCLQSVDLENENLAGKIRVRQIYIPVQDGIWLPVSHNFIINLDIIGLMADIGYGSSVKYKNVELNTSIPKPTAISPVNTSIPVPEVKTPKTDTKNSEEISSLLSKNDLSNRDMIRLSKLMEEETVTDNKNEELEIKDNTTRIIEKDARQKDSTYWADIRPIPLSESDIRSLSVSGQIRTDSLSAGRGETNTISIGFGGKRDEAEQNTEGDSIAVNSKERSQFIKTLSAVSFGKTWSDTTGFSFRNGGLFNIGNLSFNTVDGFVYGTDFRISKTWTNDNNLVVYPELKWAFSREKLLWTINSTYYYDRLKQKFIYFRIGITSRDFNTSGGITPFINTATSLLLKKNYLKLYETRYVTLGYSQEVINGLYLDLSSDLEYRFALANSTDFSLFSKNKEYSVNLPSNKYLNGTSSPFYAPQNHTHAGLRLKLSYTPRQKYRIYEGRKIPAGSDYPTFSVLYNHGVNKFSNDSITNGSLNHSDQLWIEATNTKTKGAFSEYNWIIRTGGFINGKGITFQDFNSFNSQPFPVLLNNYRDAFMLTGFYKLNSPRFFVEGHFKYTDPYLLLKLIPGISNTLMRENLSLSYLFTRFSGSYTELGYSISEIMFLGEVGVYTGFRDLKYNSTGVKIVLRFN